MDNKYWQLLEELEHTSNEEDRAWLALQFNLNNLPKTLQDIIWKISDHKWFSRESLKSLLNVDLTDDLWNKLINLSYVETYPNKGWNIHKSTSDLLFKKKNKELEIRKTNTNNLDDLSGKDSDTVDFIEKLYTTKTFDEAFDTYYQKILNIGFRGAFYTCTPRLYFEKALQLVPTFNVCEFRAPQFIQHYIQSELQERNFVIKALDSDIAKPIDCFNWEEKTSSYLGTLDKNILEVDKEEWGIHSGVTIQLSTSIGIAGVSIISGETDELHKTLVTENLQTLQTCTNIFHTQVVSNSNLQKRLSLSVFETLTEDEKCVLRFITTGNPLGSIDESYDISPKYAENVLFNVKKKFGDITTTQLVYNLGLLQLLD